MTKKQKLTKRQKHQHPTSDELEARFKTIINKPRPSMSWIEMPKIIEKV